MTLVEEIGPATLTIQTAAPVVTTDVRELEMLEHLSYTIEAIAEDVSSEAKCEVGRLHELVEADTGLAAEVKREALGCLGHAQELIEQHPFEVHKAAASLCRLSRFLWKRVLESERKAAEQCSRRCDG